MNSTAGSTYLTVTEWRGVQSQSGAVTAYSLTASPAYVFYEQKRPVVKLTVDRFPQKHVDPKDLLMEDLGALHSLYSEFEEEDRGLAEMGLEDYNRTLHKEDSLE